MELRDKIERLFAQYGYDELITHIIDLFPQWISVDDRLPENGEPVLVVRYNSHDIGFYDAEDATFCNDEGTRQFKGITHWMTLPELPKVD